MDGGIAEDILAAAKCHVAWVLALAIPNPDTDDEQGMTSEEESEDERVTNHLTSVRILTYQETHKKLLAAVTLDPTPNNLLGGGATTVKRCRKTNGAKRLLAASCVGGVVQHMRKRILADYERDVFSREARLRPGQEHPKVRGTERLGFAKLDLYPKARSKSVRPTRVVGKRATTEQKRVEYFLAHGLIDQGSASK